MPPPIYVAFQLDFCSLLKVVYPCQKGINSEMIWVNIESGDGLVPDSTKPSSWNCADYAIKKA